MSKHESSGWVQDPCKKPSVAPCPCKPNTVEGRDILISRFWVTTNLVPGLVRDHVSKNKALSEKSRHLISLPGLFIHMCPHRTHEIPIDSFLNVNILLNLSQWLTRDLHLHSIMYEMSILFITSFVLTVLYFW